MSEIGIEYLYDGVFFRPSIQIAPAVLIGESTPAGLVGLFFKLGFNK